LLTIGGGIICGLVVLAGWWLFSGKNETHSLSPPEIAQQVSMPQQSPPEPVASDKTEQVQAAAETAINSGPETISKNSREKIALPAQNNFPAAADMRSAGIQPEMLEVPQLNGPDMKLQAVTWSRESHKRIAVINNRILHEGETVSGYLLVTINQDDVVLGRDGRTWKLLFHTN
jgi:type II secretory pathway component PulC